MVVVKLGMLASCLLFVSPYLHILANEHVHTMHAVILMLRLLSCFCEGSECDEAKHIVHSVLIAGRV